MATSQNDKAQRFRDVPDGLCFVMPNPWDAGSVLALQDLGFSALATSSGAAAGVFGRRDGALTRDEALAHTRTIADCTDLPVAADLENGFGDAPADAALTIRLAAEVGLVVGSIEDASGVQDRCLWALTHAAERVVAATEATRALPLPFTRTARAENLLRGNPDLDNAIARLEAFDKAGADVLFAPALPDLQAVRAVCAAVSRPVNFMVGMKGIAAHQSGHLAVPCRHGRPDAGGNRGQAAGPLRLGRATVSAHGRSTALNPERPARKHSPVNRPRARLNLDCAA
jgi:2-methylisocitrate lyase-like PEP mutase family enzyme